MRRKILDSPERSLTRTSFLKNRMTKGVTMINWERRERHSKNKEGYANYRSSSLAILDTREIEFSETSVRLIL
jgi:hypothetical protein